MSKKFKIVPIKKEVNDSNDSENDEDPIELFEEELETTCDENVVKTETLSNVSSWKAYPLYCFLCAYSTYKFPMLTRHALSKHSKEVTSITKIQYQCVDCKKICDTYCKFLNHVRNQHHPNLKLCCDICSEFCQSYDELAKHHLKHKGTSDASQPFVRHCTLCSKVCPSRISINKHIVTHDEGLECQVCKKSFKRLKYLKRHMEQHDESKYACDFCGKTFARQFNKISHERTHTGERPYQCDTCGQRFSFSTTWKNHMRTHTGEKTYKCDECDVKFRHFDSLKEHKRTHTNEMPYKCIPCDKDFRFRKSLNRHMQEQHTIRPGVKNKALPLKKRPTKDLNANGDKPQKRKQPSKSKNKN